MRQLEIEQIKETTNKEWKELGIEKNDEFKKLDENLRFRRIRNKFQGRSDSSDEEEKIELREITRKKINGIDKLEKGIKQVEELNIEGESKTTKLLMDLYSEKGCVIDEMIVIEIKLEKLKIPKTTINAIKNQLLFKKMT